MAIQLRIKGTSTLSLTDITNIASMNIMLGGAAINVPVVDGSVELTFRGSVSTIRNNVTALNRLITEVKQRQIDPSVQKVYLEGDNGGGWYRSELKDIYIDAGSNYFDQIERGASPVTLRFTRVNYWENAIETAIPISNLNGTNLTSGLNVYNANDLVGTSPNRRCNYFDIAAGVIGGDLPAPLNLSITNVHASLNLYRTLIGLNSTNPTTATWKWEAEAIRTVAASTISNAAASAGAYAGGTMSPTGGGYKVPIMEFTLTSAQVTAFSGQFVRLMARAFNGVNLYTVTHKYQVEIKISDYPVWQSEWWTRPVGGSYSWLDFGVVRMPPSLAGLPSLGEVKITIYGDTLVAASWGIDDLILLPIDGYQYFNHATPAGYSLVVDNVDENYYVSGASATNLKPVFSWIGKPLLLTPAKATRLYLLTQWGITGADITGVVSVEATYRERKATL